jgi:hypothetical protein
VEYIYIYAGMYLIDDPRHSRNSNGFSILNTHRHTHTCWNLIEPNPPLMIRLSSAQWSLENQNSAGGGEGGRGEGEGGGIVGGGKELGYKGRKHGRTEVGRKKFRLLREGYKGTWRKFGRERDGTRGRGEGGRRENSERRKEEKIKTQIKAIRGKGEGRERSEERGREEEDRERKLWRKGERRRKRGRKEWEYWEEGGRKDRNGEGRGKEREDGETEEGERTTGGGRKIR